LLFRLPALSMPCGRTWCRRKAPAVSRDEAKLVPVLAPLFVTFYCPIFVLCLGKLKFLCFSPDDLGSCFSNDYDNFFLGESLSYLAIVPMSELRLLL